MTGLELDELDHWKDGGVTVGELRAQLSNYPDDARLIFGPDSQGHAVRFYRVKTRGEALVQIEFA